MRFEKMAAVPLLVLAAVAPVAAQEAPPSWDEYRLGQFIASGSRAPADILALDNNGEILLACRDGCSRASLEAAGIGVVASQLELLGGWSLLSAVDGGFRSAIPILDRESADRLSARATALVDEIAETLGPDVLELVRQLDADDRGRHAYAVLFSYVLDGQVWSFFDELGLIEPRNRSRGRAPWGGEVWAYLPGQGAEPRTSTFQREVASVRVAWVRGLDSLVAPLFRGPASLGTLLRNRQEAGEVESRELDTKLMEYEIIGAERQVLVALLDEREEDELYQLCRQLAETVAEAVAEKLDLGGLVEELGFANESQALVIGYYSIMWGLMDRLVESEVLALPRAIAEPAGARPSDIGKLLVMVRHPVQAPGEETDSEE